MAEQPSIIQPGKIANHTDVWGREEDGHIPIYVRDEFVDDGETKHMVTEWKPTQEQIDMLNGGASLFLSIVGKVEAKHPPVLLGIAHSPIEVEDNG